MRLEVGMIIRTNYGTGPYRITKLHRDCICSVNPTLNHTMTGTNPQRSPLGKTYPPPARSLLDRRMSAGFPSRRFLSR